MTGSEDIRNRSGQVVLERGQVRLRAAAMRGHGVSAAKAASAAREEAAVVLDLQGAAGPDGPSHVHVAGRAAPSDGADVAPAEGERDQASDLSVVAVRDLIAARLQSEAVRRIFAAGLTLQSAAGLTDAPEVRRRIEAAIGELDQAIRDVRAAVFDAGLGPRSAVGRAIGVPLTPVTKGLSRILTDGRSRRSDGVAAWIAQIPKLIVRVRFPSPAP